MAARAAAAVAELGHPMPDGAGIRVTCSVGLALYPRDGRGARALLRAADAAMYADKRSRAESRDERRSGAASASTAVVDGSV